MKEQEKKRIIDLSYDHAKVKKVFKIFHNGQLEFGPRMQGLFHIRKFINLSH